MQKESEWMSMHMYVRERERERKREREGGPLITYRTLMKKDPCMVGLTIKLYWWSVGINFMSKLICHSIVRFYPDIIWTRWLTILYPSKNSCSKGMPAVVRMVYTLMYLVTTLERAPFKAARMVHDIMGKAPAPCSVCKPVLPHPQACWTVGNF